jgi:1-acyl-sn-glycerol-3-phosphate acyltransferase
VEGLPELERRGWYLVLANHQSWVDILVLQRIFNRGLIACGLINQTFPAPVLSASRPVTARARQSFEMIPSRGFSRFMPSFRLCFQPRIPRRRRSLG